MARRIAAMAAAAVMALLLLPLGQAEARPTDEEHPHGLPYQSPLALSPAAYEFFHPSARRERARQAAHGGVVAPALAPRGQQQLRESVAAVARADQEEGGAAPVGTGRHGAFHPGKVAFVLAGASAVALVAVGVAYAVVRRRLARGGGTEATTGAPKSNA